MNSLFPVIKDFVISAIIALLTANLFSLSNLVYQIIISILILLLIFFILRGLDKMAKRMEILSILYCEVFIKRVLESFDANIGTELNHTIVNKIKLFIILPKNKDELHSIGERIKQLDRFTLKNTNTRSWFVNGKLLGDNLIVFDTPSSWIAGINTLIESEKIKPKNVARLLNKMNEGIKLYAKKNMVYENRKLNFIEISEFETYFD
jgi:hypothetical protein